MLEYLTDGIHLICRPYSVDNLHKMAKSIGLKRCWFHQSSTGLHHYDLPKRREAEIINVCTVLNSQEIVSIIRQSQV